jgi:hypothetical protein
MRLLSRLEKEEISTSPSWNATATTEYFTPITKGLYGYARGLLTFYPSNAHAV